MITSERILPNLYEVSYYHKYSQNTTDLYWWFNFIKKKCKNNPNSTRLGIKEFINLKCLLNICICHSSKEKLYKRRKRRKKCNQCRYILKNLNSNKKIELSCWKEVLKSYWVRPLISYTTVIWVMIKIWL